MSRVDEVFDKWSRGCGWEYRTEPPVRMLAAVVDYPIEVDPLDELRKAYIIKELSNG